MAIKKIVTNLAPKVTSRKSPNRSPPHLQYHIITSKLSQATQPNSLTISSTKHNNSPKKDNAKTSFIKKLCNKIVHKNEYSCDTGIADEKAAISQVKFIPILRLADLKGKATVARVLSPNVKSSNFCDLSIRHNKSLIVQTDYNWSTLENTYSVMEEDYLPQYLPYENKFDNPLFLKKYKAIEKVYIKRRKKAVNVIECSTTRLHNKNRYSSTNPHKKNNHKIKVEGAERVSKYNFNSTLQPPIAYKRYSLM